MTHQMPALRSPKYPVMGMADRISRASTVLKWFRCCSQETRNMVRRHVHHFVFGIVASQFLTASCKSTMDSVSTTPWHRNWGPLIVSRGKELILHAVMLTKEEYKGGKSFEEGLNAESHLESFSTHATLSLPTVGTQAGVADWRSGS